MFSKANKIILGSESSYFFKSLSMSFLRTDMRFDIDEKLPTILP